MSSVLNVTQTIAMAAMIVGGVLVVVTDVSQVGKMPRQEADRQHARNRTAD